MAYDTFSIAPLKLRPYGAIQMSILLLLLLRYTTLHCAGAASTSFPQKFAPYHGGSGVCIVCNTSFLVPTLPIITNGISLSSQPFFQNTQSLPVDIQTDRQNDDGI